MSNAAPEANHSNETSEVVKKIPRLPEDLAWYVDVQLAEIAKRVPKQVMTSPQGTQVMHELYRLEGVGTLYASYLGHLVGKRQLGQAFDPHNPDDAYVGVDIAIRSGDAEIRNKFALDWWRKPYFIDFTSPDHIRSIQPSFPAPGLEEIVDAVHKAYMNLGDASASVTDLNEYARNRADQ